MCSKYLFESMGGKESSTGVLPISLISLMMFVYVVTKFEMVLSGRCSLSGSSDTSFQL